MDDLNDYKNRGCSSYGHWGGGYQKAQPQDGVTGLSGGKNGLGGDGRQYWFRGE